MSRNLNRAKKFLFASMAALTMHAQTQSGPPAFEVASVKPHVFARGEFAFGTVSHESPIRIVGNRVTASGLLAGLVMAAYKLRSFQVSGAPDWRNDTDRHQIYEIEAKTPDGAAPTMDRVRQMLQTLLAERFQLKFHRETKEMPAYDLVVGNNPPKLRPSQLDAESKILSSTRLREVYRNVPMSELVIRIAPNFDRPLFDRTGLQGGYDFSLEYMPSLPGGVSAEVAEAVAKLYAADDAPPLTVALQQQLGLKVTPAKEQVEILVIDHVERPSPN